MRVARSSSFSKYSRRRLPNRLAIAWLSLLALSLFTALLTAVPLPPKLVGAGILFLALAKSRVILARYLDLDQSPAWLRGFSIVLTVFVFVLLGLFFAAP